MWTLILHSLVIVNKIECQQKEDLPAEKYVLSDDNKAVRINEKPWMDGESRGEYNYIFTVPRPSFLR